MTTVSQTTGADPRGPNRVRYFRMPRRRRRWPWVVFYSVWAVVAILAAAAWGVDRAAQHVLDQISPNNASNTAARKVLVTPTGPDTTFLVLGSDHRNWIPGSESLSDSMVLVRMSPRNNLISIMSIPRDLKVTIPGYAGYYKINAAFSLGGPQLSIRTVETNLNVPINHYVDVGFQGFFKIVQNMGGLYTQVDRRYYNPIGTGYSPIDLQPGYQRLNGNQALSFARFRHTDTDIVRAARQQQIIIDLKRQASARLGFGDIPTLLNTISSSIQTDIHSLGTLINLGQFLLGLPHGRIFHTTLQVGFSTGGGPAYDIATPQMVASSVNQFLNPLSVATPRIRTATATVAGRTSTAAAQGAGPHPAATRRAGGPSANALPAGLVVDPAGATALRGLGRVGLPLLVPTLRDVNSGLDPTLPARVYRIDGGPHGYAAVVAVYRNYSQAGSYYDVQETQMPNPPIMQGPTSKIVAGKRTYLLFQDGGVLRYVGFYLNHTWYWVSNTFGGALSPKEMVGIAASLQPAGRPIKAPTGLGRLTAGIR